MKMEGRMEEEGGGTREKLSLCDVGMAGGGARRTSERVTSDHEGSCSLQKVHKIVT